MLLNMSLLRLRSRFPLLLLLPAILLVAAACASPANGPAGQITAESTTAPDQSIQTAATAASTRDTSINALHPDDLHTGITGLDPVLEAIAGRDPETIAARLQLLETPCTTADGLGGPPKCAEGVADGTVVTVFPVLESEGTFIPANGLLPLAESLDIKGLFGIYQVTGGPSAEEAYWPSGAYGVVLAGSGAVPAYTLLVDGGNIVRIIYHLDTGPESAFDNGRGTILLPPLQ